MKFMKKKMNSDIFKHAGMFAEDLSKGTDCDVFRRIILLGYDVYLLMKIWWIIIVKELIK